MKNCPCGSNQAYTSCCQPFLKGLTHPKTAEALMRSRYTAYVEKNIDYLVATHRPPNCVVDREGIRVWATMAIWQGLKIVLKEAGDENDNFGVVEFEAHYEAQGTRGILRERSRFHKVRGHWFYVDGDVS